MVGSQSDETVKNKMKNAMELGLIYEATVAAYLSCSLNS